MKKIFLGIAMLCIAVVLIAGCTQPTPPATPTPTATSTPTAVPTQPVMHAYNESANGTTVNLPLGTSFIVELQENPTTGYSWDVMVTDGLEITNDTYLPPESGLIGAGGSHIWDVMTTKTGLQEFSGIYMRPFENVTGNETTYVLWCNVTG